MNFFKLTGTGLFIFYLMGYDIIDYGINGAISQRAAIDYPGYESV